MSALCELLKLPYSTRKAYVKLILDEFECNTIYELGKIDIELGYNLSILIRETVYIEHQGNKESLQ